MRMNNSLKNIKFNIIFFLVNSLLIFVSKTVLIKYLGSEYTGLNTIFTNLISFMNVAEMGITSAITYSLYRPLEYKDYKTINSLLNAFRGIYRIIGIIVSMIAIIFMMFISKIIPNSSIGYAYIYIYFIIFALKTILSYYFTYLQILIVADQRSYIITKISGTINIIKVLLQIITSIIFKNYTLWIVLEFGFTLFNFFIINLKIKKTYYWLNFDNEKFNFLEFFKKHRDITQNTKNLIIHKISKVIIYQTDSILLSSFTSLQMVTIYSNYAMITNLINSLLSQIFNGIKSSIGSLIAEGDNQKVYHLWKEIIYIGFIIALISSYCFYKNVNNLIYIWLGKEYIISNEIVVIIALNMLFLTLRNIMDIFKEGYGLFWDKNISLVEALINFIISIILVRRIGLMGIVLGTAVGNMFIVLFWQPYVIYKYGFKRTGKECFIIIIKYLFLTLLALFFSNIILKNLYINIQNNFILFVYQSCISGCSMLLSLSFISLLDRDIRQIYIKYFNFFNNLLKSILKIKLN